MACALSRFSELQTSSKNKTSVRSTAFWLPVQKTWCFENENAIEMENYESEEPNILQNK